MLDIIETCRRSSFVAHGIAVAVVAVTSLGAAGAYAGEVVNTGYFGGIAIMGYDPVAYFVDGRPIKGSEQFAYEWLDTPWHFANDKHRQLFMSDPVRYAPQYGGYCVLGTAFGGSTMNIDPEAWRIIDGKLYLNYSEAAFADADFDTPARTEELSLIHI